MNIKQVLPLQMRTVMEWSPAMRPPVAAVAAAVAVAVAVVNNSIQPAV